MTSMRIKQSFCYPCFVSEGVSVDELFAEAARIGFPATEWWFRDDSFDEVVELTKKHGLAIASICGHRALNDGLNKRDNHDRIEAELHESIDLAVKLGIPGLICFSGNCQEDQDEEDAIDACAEGLARVAPYAEKHGINLNIELLNSKVNHPGYQCDHTPWGVAVCERVGSPNVKLLYDIYHMQIMEGDVIRTIRDNIQWIGHFHTAGNPGRQDMDDEQELNYPAICRAIAASGYTNYVGHEFTPKGNRIDGLRTAFTLCDVDAG